jgi:hypothetical protein
LPAVPDGTQLQEAQHTPQYLRQSSCLLAFEHLTLHLPSQKSDPAMETWREEEAKSRSRRRARVVVVLSFIVLVNAGPRLQASSFRVGVLWRV